MKVRFVRVLVMALIAISASALSATAQITTGTVTGTVRDAQGGVISERVNRQACLPIIRFE